MSILKTAMSLVLSCAILSLTVLGAPRVLILDGFNNHDWQRNTQHLQQVLKAAQVEVSVATYGTKTWPPDLNNYRVIIQTCNNLGQEIDWTPEFKQNFANWVQSGGGVIIHHSANNSFVNWADYNRIIGLGWRDKHFGSALTIDQSGSVQRTLRGEGGNTNHGKRLEAQIQTRGGHPLVVDLPKVWKAADLEVYRWARGPAEKLTVLSYANEAETGLNFPVEWLVRYGEGEAYVSTFGHLWQGQLDPPGIRCAGYQSQLIRAVHYLAGESVPPVPADFPSPDEVSLR